MYLPPAEMKQLSQRECGAMTIDRPAALGSLEAGQQWDENQGRLVTCAVDGLHPHPSYIRHHLTVPASRLSALAQRGDSAFQEPLVIAQDHTIIDGYARFELARLKGRRELSCLEYCLTDQEILQWFLQLHRRSSGVNDFCRILMALDLESWLREKALANQRLGGEGKGSSKLTEANRIDVRSEVAAAAGVSVGNVTKVKQLIAKAPPEILQALRNGEVRIHRAWLWSRTSPEKQGEELRLYQSRRDIKRTIRTLVARHRAKDLTTAPDPRNLLRRLASLESREPGFLKVVVIDGKDKTLYITKGAMNGLGLFEEPASTCATSSH